jgi:hypothetical protein
MNPLAKRIVLLVSLFCLVIGLFLLGYNLRYISSRATATALNLWPALLVAAGIVLVIDSARKRSFTRTAAIQARDHPLPLPARVRELSLRVQFSYGRLFVSPAPGDGLLRTEQVGVVPAPAVTSELVGGSANVSLAMSQPIFPAHFQLHNTWRLSLPRALPVRLSLDIHEASVFLDLRGLDIDALDMRADTGRQEIALGRPRRSLAAKLYSSSSDLTIVLPPRSYARVRMLNPFCRVDYPQGDLEKRDDGSLVTTAPAGTAGSIDIDIDGPLKNLVLDVEESPAPSRAASRTRRGGTGRRTKT